MCCWAGAACGGRIELDDHKPADRKTQILDAMADMLRQPYSARITTAALARRLGVSEGALYRHFPGKAAILESLIVLIEAQVLEDLGHIAATEPDARMRLRKQAHALLLFAERHPGLTRVLTGDALAGEAESVQARLDAAIVRIQTVLTQGLPDGADANGRDLAPHIALRADVLMHWILGRWLRYAQTGWRAAPTRDYARQLDLLGLPAGDAPPRRPFSVPRKPGTRDRA